jgi:hypothetical protein
MRMWGEPVLFFPIGDYIRGILRPQLFEKIGEPDLACIDERFLDLVPQTSKAREHDRPVSTTKHALACLVSDDVWFEYFQVFARVCGHTADFNDTDSPPIDRNRVNRALRRG